eukprot:SAG31_NODE_11978_length_980_cov_1.242906_1_plen_40_part_10
MSVPAGTGTGTWSAAGTLPPVYYPDAVECTDLALNLGGWR